MSRIQESEKIYHSYLNKNKDGSNRLLEKGDQCCTPTNSSFWKWPWDVTNGVRTRSQEREQIKVDVEKFNRYFQIYGIFNGGWRQVIRRWKF